MRIMDKRYNREYSPEWRKDLYEDLFPEEALEMPFCVEMIENIAYAIDQLTDNEKRVILERYQNRKSVCEIAEELGVSVERIRQHIRKAFWKMRKPDVMYRIQNGNLAVKTKADEDGGELPIEFIGLPDRIYNSLKRANVNTLEELIETANDEERLMKVRNLGPKSRGILKQKLDEFLMG